MLRRLFFVMPDEEHAVQLVADVEAAGVDRPHVHSLTRDDRKPGSLPAATDRQRRDAVWRVERTYWIALLTIFGIGLVALVGAWNAGSAIGIVISAVVMLGAFLAGVLFVRRIPDAHLDEFRGALAHGEVVIMVDVPPRRVREIEDMVERRHPEAVAGGVGWTPGTLGI